VLWCKRLHLISTYILSNTFRLLQKVKDYDPRVVDQLLSFMHSYTSQVLQDAHEAAREVQTSGSDIVVTTDDVAIATRLQGHHAFIEQPGLNDIGMLAAHVNRVPLPEIPERHGLRIPADEMDCLTNPNIQIPTPPTQKKVISKQQHDRKGSSLANQNHTISMNIS
jgi:hypothetical protein